MILGTYGTLGVYGAGGVADTTAPVITINPIQTSYSLTVGASFTPPVGTSTDAFDGTQTITPTGSVNTNTEGTYTLTYSDSDAAGNVATPVIVTVNVSAAADTTAPVITVSGSPSTTITVGGTAPTFTSSTDDGSAVVVGGDTVNVNTVGTYTITFNATDGSGNVATQVTRTVIVEAEVVADTTAPVITVSGNASTAIAQGGTAPIFTSSTDDGSVVIVGGDTVDVNTVGSYTITFNATDSSGNAATQVTRTVVVTDTTAPVITVSGTETTTITVGDALPTFTASTDDGSPITTTGTVNNNVEGTYIITYNSTDAAGNVATPVVRTVIVQAATVADTTAPVITLSPANTVYNLNVDDPFNLPVATVTDNVDVNRVITPESNNVNTAVAGSYSVVYNATDAASNAATQVTITVNVTAVADSASLQALARAQFILDGDNRYTRISGRANQSAFRFKLATASTNIVQTAEGYFDWDSNNIERVEVIAGDSIISSDTGAVSFADNYMYAELGLLTGFGQQALKVVIYVTGDTKGIVIAGPNLRAAPIITML